MLLLIIRTKNDCFLGRWEAKEKRSRRGYDEKRKKREAEEATFDLADIALPHSGSILQVCCIFYNFAYF